MYSYTESAMSEAAVMGESRRARRKNAGPADVPLRERPVGVVALLPTTGAAFKSRKNKSR